MEELVKRLRAAAIMSDALSVFLPHSEGSAVAKLYNEAADAIENLQADKAALNGTVTNLLEQIKDLSKPKWIPVAERLPDVFKHVLVNIPGMAPHPTVQEAFREKNGMWYSNGFRYEADDITHWMPLPQPPEEE